MRSLIGGLAGIKPANPLAIPPRLAEDGDSRNLVEEEVRVSIIKLKDPPVPDLLKLLKQQWHLLSEHERMEFLDEVGKLP